MIVHLSGRRKASLIPAIDASNQSDRRVRVRSSLFDKLFGSQGHQQSHRHSIIMDHSSRWRLGKWHAVHDLLGTTRTDESIPESRVSPRMKGQKIIEVVGRET